MNEIISEAKYVGTLLVGFAISDKNGHLLFRYQKKTFSQNEDSKRSFIYPVPKFALITGGYGEWHIDNTVYDLQQGDLVLLRPGSIRYFDNIDPKAPLTCDIYEFVPSFLMGMNCLDIFKMDVTSDNTIIRNINGSNNDMIEILDKVKSELNTTPNGCADMIRAYLAMVTVKASRKLGIAIGSDKVMPWSTSLVTLENSTPFEYSRGGAASQEAEHTLAIAYIMDLIRNNVSGKFSIDQLATEAHMSRSHFFKVFRRHTGLSVNDFILKCRIESTIKLLSETGCNILDAAYASGFTSSSGFYKSFKKITGKAPKEYLSESSERDM